MKDQIIRNIADEQARKYIENINPAIYWGLYLKSLNKVAEYYSDNMIDNIVMAPNHDDAGEPTDEIKDYNMLIKMVYVDFFNKLSDNDEFEAPVKEFIYNLYRFLNAKFNIEKWTALNVACLQSAYTCGFTQTKHRSEIIDQFNEIIDLWLENTKQVYDILSEQHKEKTMPVVKKQTEYNEITGATDSFADGLIKAITEARDKKDFAGADGFRKQLQDAGYEVMTTKAGTTAKRAGN